MKRPISMLGRLLPPTREEDIYVNLDGATGSLTAFQFTPKVLSDPFTCITREGSKFDTPWSPALGNGIEIRVERGIGKHRVSITVSTSRKPTASNGPRK